MGRKEMFLMSPLISSFREKDLSGRKIFPETTSPRPLYITGQKWVNIQPMPGKGQDSRIGLRHHEGPLTMYGAQSKTKIQSPCSKITKNVKTVKHLGGSVG